MKLSDLLDCLVARLDATGDIDVSVLAFDNSTTELVALSMTRDEAYAVVQVLKKTYNLI